MAWKETCAVEQRMQFVREWERNDASMASQCRAFGVSRQTGYKGVNRYFEFGEEGERELLEDRSRRPLSSPTAAGTSACTVLSNRKPRPLLEGERLLVDREGLVRWGRARVFIGRRRYPTRSRRDAVCVDASRYQPSARASARSSTINIVVIAMNKSTPFK
jgi:transposase-like protein